jgi:hypothetical protein
MHTRITTLIFAHDYLTAERKGSERRDWQIASIRARVVLAAGLWSHRRYPSVAFLNSEREILVGYATISSDGMSNLLILEFSRNGRRVFGRVYEEVVR